MEGARGSVGKSQRVIVEGVQEKVRKKNKRGNNPVRHYKIFRFLGLVLQLQRLLQSLAT